MFKIRMGIPEMKDFWDNLKRKNEDGTANKNEVIQFRN